ncbi:hypothetical protein Lal_00015246 [Lupinus albus]|nr:hypothetical protein Lal_00015246 [Lupinus albus]
MTNVTTSNKSIIEVTTTYTLPIENQIVYLLKANDLYGYVIGDIRSPLPMFEFGGTVLITQSALINNVKIIMSILIFSDHMSLMPKLSSPLLIPLLQHGQA